MNRVKVSLGERSYNILIGPGLLSKSGAIIKKLNIGRDAVVITNKVLRRAYGVTLKNSLNKSGISVKFELVPDSEKAKSSRTLLKVLNHIAAYDKKRSVFIIAFGGGVIGDLAGFVAASYKRGIPYVQIPTTLLAQVDSSVGGKVAIDLPAAKNLAGAFYQPKAVISDINVLMSLSPRQVCNGLAEIIKYGAIKDRALFAYLEKNFRLAAALDKKVLKTLIMRSVRIKARLVGEDEFDKKGKRMILNYGHTIGHAIEAASSYSNRYNHGEAIAIGMCVAADIACGLNLLKRADAERIERLIKRCGLPTKIEGLKFSSIYEAHLHDKKFAKAKNRFVLPCATGDVRIVEAVPDRVIVAAIKRRLLNLRKGLYICIP
ncbi:MAG: 3-dehydroquinate synthase [Candidatus Omnitrophota bacterium]|nr:3-dehydroquinate synthase [Candidatus Omnitrophota bacterium]